MRFKSQTSSIPEDTDTIESIPKDTDTIKLTTRTTSPNSTYFNINEVRTWKLEKEAQSESRNFPSQMQRRPTPPMLILEI